MLPIYFAQNEVGPFVKTNIGNKSSLLLFVVVLFTLVSNFGASASTCFTIFIRTSSSAK